MQNNLAKARVALEQASKATGRAALTLGELLRWEVDEQMHRCGAPSAVVLADPSAAVALLWLRRSVAFNLALFRHLQPSIQAFIKGTRADIDPAVAPALALARALARDLARALLTLALARTPTPTLTSNQARATTLTASPPSAPPTPMSCSHTTSGCYGAPSPSLSRTRPATTTSPSPSAPASATSSATT